jgi:hypothetical protein
MCNYYYINNGFYVYNLGFDSTAVKFLFNKQKDLKVINYAKFILHNKCQYC